MKAAVLETGGKACRTRLQLAQSTFPTDHFYGIYACHYLVLPGSTSSAAHERRRRDSPPKRSCTVKQCDIARCKSDSRPNQPGFSAMARGTQGSIEQWPKSAEKQGLKHLLQLHLHMQTPLASVFLGTLRSPPTPPQLPSPYLFLLLLPILPHFQCSVTAIYITSNHLIDSPSPATQPHKLNTNHARPQHPSPAPPPLPPRLRQPRGPRPHPSDPGRQAKPTYGGDASGSRSVPAGQIGISGHGSEGSGPRG